MANTVGSIGLSNLGSVCPGSALGPPSNAPGQSSLPPGAPVSCGNGITFPNGSAAASGAAGSFPDPWAMAGSALGAVFGAPAGSPGVYIQPVYDSSGNQTGVWESYDPPSGWSGGFTSLTKFGPNGSSTTTVWFSNGNKATEFNPGQGPAVALPPGQEAASANGAEPSSPDGYTASSVVVTGGIPPARHG